MKKDILHQIIETKKEEVAACKRVLSENRLEERLKNQEYEKRSMRDALRKSGSGIIAEFKRRSPSRGWIREDAEIAEIIPQYTRHGASALSVLTDTAYFGGRLEDLRNARSLTHLPLLRKDFIIDPYQLKEAREAGADAILLIAAALPLSLCEELALEAKSLGLETLLEVHSEEELEYVSPAVDMLGVNNRHLGTFHTDVTRSFEIAERLPAAQLLISESGISTPSQVAALRKAGFRGFLMGEHFMSKEKPGASLSGFIRNL